MQYKEMRAQLKEKGLKPIPLKNTEMYQLYLKTFPDYEGSEPAVQTEVAKVGNEYTYIGFGDEPPPVIKFMGLQVFTRGIPTMVTNAEVLAKIGTNRSFVKGKVDGERIVEQDELAKKRCEKIREEDTKIQIMSERKNRG